ncbi:MAG: sigma 54-interacting transcriptional regulator [Steroidobacteraceae bacterium]
MALQRLIEQFNLRSRLRFNQEAGQVWLDESRMLLLHARALGSLRRELLDALGDRRARGMLLRMGYVGGQQDAALARTLLGAGDNYDVFKIGPELHAFEGMVTPTLSEAEIDWERGTFRGKVQFEGSWEAESHLQQFGPSTEPVCHTLVGYATGYASRFFERFIVFREVQCVARGDACCSMEGKPAEDWADDDFRFYFETGQPDVELRRIEEELEHLRGPARELENLGELVGASPAFRQAFDLLSKSARSPITVLLLGETGVGKEMFARWLHDHSDRKDKAFVAVNCAAIPHDLVESELFGVMKGAYTGAQQSRPGRFERADGGTLFLDEVGDLPPSAQAKLLRVLQTGEVERLGDDHARKVNVRLVAATNVNLAQAIADGRFRNDLYYRLSTYPVTIPPLRERSQDILLLAATFVAKYEAVYQKKVAGLSDRAVKAVLAHSWPGNVRELQNLIERAVLLTSPGHPIEVDQLFPGTGPMVGGTTLSASGQLAEAAATPSSDQACDRLLHEGFNLEAHEAQLLQAALARAKGNLTHAARLLGLTRRQLAYRLKRGPGGV